MTKLSEKGQKPFSLCSNWSFDLTPSRCRRSTCALHLSALAISDSVVLLLGLYLWCTLTFGAFMTWASCVVPTYLLLSATQCGTLIMVTMTCDRFEQTQ